MKKRMVCAVLCCALLALCWGGLPAGAATGERTGTTADGLCYTLTMGRAVITGCEQPAELYDLAVPALIEGYPVTAIGYGAFRGCENLQTVTLPEGLTTLQAEAFADCAALQTVSLPRSLTAVQERAFAHNAALTDMPLPAGLAAIGDGAFAGCTGLAGLILPRYLATLSGGALVGVDRVRVDPQNEFFTARNGVVLTKDGATLVAFTDPDAAAYTLPASVTAVGPAAFAERDNLQTVDLTGAVSVGENAFAGCAGLAAVTLPQTGQTVWNAGVFAGCTALQAMELPPMFDLPDRFFAGCASLRSVTLSAGLAGVGDYAFSGCRALETVTLPLTVNSLGAYAFAGCTGLEHMDLANVQFVDRGAFSACTGLQAVTAPRLCEAAAEAFAGCGALTDFDMTALTAIGAGAFRGCGFDQITLPAGVVQVENNAFADCVALKTVTVLGDPAVGEGAFGGQTAAVHPVLRGHADQNAERYARANGLAFEPLEQVITDPDSGACLILPGDATPLPAGRLQVTCGQPTQQRMAVTVTYTDEAGRPVALPGPVTLRLALTVDEPVGRVHFIDTETGRALPKSSVWSADGVDYVSVTIHRFGPYEIRWVRPTGDVNDDGRVDARDALLVLQAAVGKLALADEDKPVADGNADGRVDARDALLILRFAVGKINRFPADDAPPAVTPTEP